MNRLMAKHFPGSGLLVIGLLLVISVTPPMCNSLVLRVSEIWQFAFPTFVASNNCARDHFKETGT